MSPLPANQPSPWPHRWAWLLACATFPLVWWGGFVSATGSGMAFRDWLTSDGALMPIYPWLSSAGDKFIDEHGHRLLGMLAGVLTIALVLVCWRCESRRWVRWCSLGLFAGVLAQGVLGGMRVLLDERVLALIHGCTGPLFFAAAAGMVAVTSPKWATAASEIETPSAHRLARLAALTAVIAYLQLVVGAVVRHSPHMLGDRSAAVFQTAVYFHLVLAAAVTFHTLLLVVKCLRRRVCRGAALGLAALLAVQILLGVSTWMVKYGMPAWATRLIGETGHFNRASDLASAGIVAGHGAVGALIVALATAMALHVARRLGASQSSLGHGSFPVARILA
jgi:heme a synthase